MATYGETATVKTDLGITGTAFDAQLTDWEAKATQEWDDLLVIYGRKRNRITQLPELPLATAEITETDKDGTNHLIRKRYYQAQKNFEAAEQEYKEAKRLADQRVQVLKEDAHIHGRIIT